MSTISVCYGKEDQSFTIYWENDGTFAKPYQRTDRHYTNGSKIVYTQQPDSNWLKDFGKWNNFGQDDQTQGVKTAMGYFFGQNMYTPDNIHNPAERDKHDMVFAGWLYGGVFAQRRTQSQMEHFELNIGVIGPASLVGRTQHIVHRALNIDEPVGWDDQLRNEAAADFSWFKRQYLDLQPLRRTSNFDTQLEYGFTAGTVQRNAILGLIVRAGINLPDDFGPGRLESPDCAIVSDSDKIKHFYVFSRVGGKLVEFNRFLTGLETETAVGQLQAGVAFQYKTFEIRYSQTFLTREFKEQPEADSYATLVLSYRF
jgi:hypothetical protein